MENLTGKISLVTGATRGIGRAIAKMLLQEGSSVAICGRNHEATLTTVAELAKETGGKVRGKAADVKSYDDVRELFEFVDAEFGGLDVLVNNAGVGIFRPIDQVSIDEWHQVIETNLTGVFYCTREALF